jgi:hypothetical protein
MDLLIMIFFSYRNYRLAQSLSENGLKWAIITSVVWLLMQMIGCGIFLSFTSNDFSYIHKLMEAPDKTQAMDQLIYLILLGTASGYLGYILVNRSLHNTSIEEEEEFDDSEIF